MRATATEVRSIVEAVLAELGRNQNEKPTDVERKPAPPPAPAPRASPAASTSQTAPAVRPPSEQSKPAPQELNIDLDDPTVDSARHRVGVIDPINPTGLENLVASTNARIGVGRAGPRPRTQSLLLFQADHGVTQDAIFGDVPTALLDEFGLFVVSTCASDEDEYLLRPDLGRKLSDDARKTVQERCVKKPQVQIVVGDGLSAAAVTNNLAKIYPVIEQGLKSAGLSIGTPFFVQRCRVGVINDINSIVEADVVVLLIGERPGLGVADALSVYSGWRPGQGKSDAHRDVVCMITEHGGTNPLEAGAFVVEHIQNVIANETSGIDLRLKQSQER